MNVRDWKVPMANKKRNAGLLYEFLIKFISRSLVEGNKPRSQAALKILKRHFKPGTELYREFRLVNSLVRTTVSNPSVAGSIISEARTASRAFDASRLDREKSLLIRAINHSLKDDTFFDQQINEYKQFMTAQSLINDWRNPDHIDLQRSALYEDTLVSWLVSEKSGPVDPPMVSESPANQRLLIKLMSKKLEEKYGNVLTEDQKRVVRAYAVATSRDDVSHLTEQLRQTGTSITGRIDEWLTSHPQETFIAPKLREVRERIIAEDVDNVNDDTIVRFMLYSKLFTELTNEET